MMDYPQAIDFLLALVDHERQSPALPRQKRIYDLGRMNAFLELLGRPHCSARTVHVAGTKGKGSTAALIDSVLHTAGYRTGFYSSPHLHTFRERIRRDTEPIEEERFAGLVSQLEPMSRQLESDTDLGPVSLFEFMTGMAFQCFSQDSVDFQTIEVGLGGRLDATNVVTPDVCVVTSISLDHMAILGDTIAEIAADKAGIIKPGATVVIAPQCSEAMSVILDACREREARPVRVGVDVTWEGGRSDLDGQSLTVQGRLGEYQLWIPLLGRHQLENAATALAAIETLQEQGHSIAEEAIPAGMAGATWPCRLEVLARNPLVVADGAHNAYSMASLLKSLPEYFAYRRLFLIAGFSRDKSVSDMVELLAGANPVAIATRSRHPRSLSPQVLAGQMRNVEIAELAETGTVAEALALARSMAGPDDLILGTGSLFVAAELREAELGIRPELYPDLLPPDLRTSRPALG